MAMKFHMFYEGFVFDASGHRVASAIGSPQVTIAPQATAQLQTVVRRPGGIEIERIVIPDRVVYTDGENGDYFLLASAYRILDIKVGADSILPSRDPINGEMFASSNQRGGYVTPMVKVPMGQVIIATIKSLMPSD